MRDRLPRAIYVGFLPPRPGGASVSLGQLVAGMADAGMPLCAVAPMTEQAWLDVGDWYAAAHPTLRVFRYWAPSFAVMTYEPLPSAIAETQDLQVPRLVRQLTASFAPDLLIAGHDVFGYLVRDAARELGLPWCLMLRGSPTAQILAGRFPAERAAPFIELYRAADLVITVAGYMAEGLSRKLGIPGVLTIPNAIDLDVFAPRRRPPALAAELGIAAGAPVILVSGHLIGRKRPLDAVRALARLTEHPDAILVLAGEGPLRDEIVASARASGVVDRVRLPGQVPYHRMPDVFALADVVVMTSDAEGMSRACIEAMASGRPLVASDIAPARELIRDGETGLLFPLGDDAALARRLESLLADPDRRAALGRRARASVADRHIHTAIEAYLQAFAGLAGTGRRRPAGLEPEGTAP